MGRTISDTKEVVDVLLGDGDVRGRYLSENERSREWCQRDGCQYM